MSGAPCWLISWHAPHRAASSGGGDVLHLVDEQRDADSEVAAQRGHVGEQLDQVELEVAGVGTAPGGGDVDGRLPSRAARGLLALLQPGAQRERLEHPGDLVDPVGVAVAVADLAHGGVDGLGERQPQRLVGAGLDLAGAPGARDREAAQGVEQHRLPDAAQAGEHHAAVGPAGGDPLEGDLELPQLAVTTGELGRALAGAGGVGVPDRVHDRRVSSRLADSLDFLASRSVSVRRRTSRRGRCAAPRRARAPRRGQPEGAGALRAAPEREHHEPVVVVPAHPQRARATAGVEEELGSHRGGGDGAHGSMIPPASGRRPRGQGPQPPTPATSPSESHREPERRSVGRAVVEAQPLRPGRG